MTVRCFFVQYLNAFLCGGVLCAVGQVLLDRTKLTPARILVCYVTAGVLLGGLGLYAPLVEWAGAGATVPLTGFGFTLAKGVQKAVSQHGLLGALTGGISATAGGITAAISSSAQSPNAEYRASHKTAPRRSEWTGGAHSLSKNASSQNTRTGVLSLNGAKIMI